jgi:hypothetical protein
LTIEDGKEGRKMAIRLYSTRDNTGTPVSYNDACSALPKGLNDKTLSLQTDPGERWQVWTDVDFKGTESPILSGTYDFKALLLYGLVHADGNGRISSLKKLPTNTASVGSIKLYQGQNRLFGNSSGKKSGLAARGRNRAYSSA